MPSIKERLREGPPPSGYLNLIPSPVATQALAAAGADVVMIDQEHGPIGPESVPRNGRGDRQDWMLPMGARPIHR
jgi:4-hydroxy-2-oxoheptanedioate aldolase